MSDSNLARALLAPRCVALVGASADPGKNTAHFAPPGIAEAEINPLIVGAEGDGVAAVDGLIVLASS